MKNLKITLSCLLACALFGCAQSVAVPNASQNELLQYTSNAKIQTPNGVVIVVATYLSPTQIQHKDQEQFILAVSPKQAKINDVRVQNQPAHIAPISQAGAGVAMELPWASYYSVSAPATKDKVVKMSLSIDSQTTELSFLKESRSLSQNP